MSEQRDERRARLTMYFGVQWGLVQAIYMHHWRGRRMVRSQVATTIEVIGLVTAALFFWFAGDRWVAVGALMWAVASLVLHFRRVEKLRVGR